VVNESEPSLLRLVTVSITGRWLDEDGDVEPRVAVSFNATEGVHISERTPGAPRLRGTEGTLPDRISTAQNHGNPDGVRRKGRARR